MDFLRNALLYAFAVLFLYTASKTPFTNAPESSFENFFAMFTASLITTLNGVFASRNS
jgi:hypothetical protein